MNPLAVQYTVAVANSAALEARELDQAGAATEAALRSTRWSLVLAQGLTLAAGIRLCLFISREVDRVFGGIVASRTDVSHQISSTAAQVSSSSRSLAEGAGHQAAALEETMPPGARSPRQNPNNPRFNPTGQAWLVGPARKAERAVLKSLWRELLYTIRSL
jgi:methyl-accepting chemotaxis protein